MDRTAERIMNGQCREELRNDLEQVYDNIQEHLAEHGEDELEVSVNGLLRHLRFRKVNAIQIYSDKLTPRHGDAGSVRIVEESDGEEWERIFVIRHADFQAREDSSTPTGLAYLEFLQAVARERGVETGPIVEELCKEEEPKDPSTIEMPPTTYLRHIHPN